MDKSQLKISSIFVNERKKIKQFFLHEFNF